MDRVRSFRGPAHGHHREAHFGASRSELEKSFVRALSLLQSTDLYSIPSASR